MRKLIAVGLSLFLAGPASALPTITQKSPNTCFASAVSTINCSLPGNVTAGHMVIVCVGDSAVSTTINTPTMTGETFTKITTMSNNPGSNGQMACYATNSAVGGAAQVTATASAAHDIHVIVVEVQGQAASPQEATGNIASATMSVATSGSASAHDLVLAFFFDDTTNKTHAAAGSYVSVQQTNNAVGGDSFFCEQLADSSSGIQTATATTNNADIENQGIIAILASAVAAGGGGGNKMSRMEKYE